MLEKFKTEEKIQRIFFLLLNQGETKDSFRYTFSDSFRETRFMSLFADGKLKKKKIKSKVKAKKIQKNSSYFIARVFRVNWAVFGT